MRYYVSFNTINIDGPRTYTWFVFDETGMTLAASFTTKDAALAWAMRSHGWRD